MDISMHQIVRPKVEKMLNLALNENQVINHMHVTDLIMVHYPLWFIEKLQGHFFLPL